MLKHCFFKVAGALARGNRTALDGQITVNSNRSHRPKPWVPGRGGALWAALAAVGLLLTGSPGWSGPLRLNREFNERGNILIADQFNNRAIEISPAGNIVWSFGLGPNDFSARSIIGVNDVQRVGRFTLMAGTGTPAGVVPQAPDGAPDNRVLLVDPFGKIVWQYGQFGQTGSGPNLLNAPVQSTWLPNTHVLITDQANNRVIRVNHAGVIVASYGLPLAGGPVDPFPFGINVGYDLQMTQKGLYSPYDAKVVGDYTGLTPPFDFDGDGDD